MEERPRGVPEEAFWSEDEDEWCLAERDDDGEYHGVVTWWRPDGTRCCVTDYVHGTPHGSFRRYHENGEVSREGRFEEGQLHGKNVFHRSTGETTESFPYGLSDAVARAEMDYEHGRIVAARCYDASGRQCMENGEPFPDARPEGVPEDAHFRKRESDGEYRWVSGSVIDRGDGTIARTGAWRFWSAEGVLVAEESYLEGELHGLVRTYDPESGASTEERTYEAGEKKGPFLRSLDEEERAGTSVAKERGTAEGDDVVGVVDYLDGDGRVVASVDTGLADDLEATQAVLSSQSMLSDLATRLLAEKKFGAAILALARAAGRGETPADRLSEALRRLERPWSRDATIEVTQRAKMVASNIARFGGGPDKCVNHLMDGIRQGGLGAELLRQSAAMLDDMGEAELASEVIDAAIAVAPADVAGSYEYTRALIRASRGDAEGARASVDALAAAESPMARGMSSYISALFPTYGFWPATDGRMAAIERLSPMLSRVEGRRRIEPGAVREAIQKCATRLARHRERLVELFGEPSWLVPDVSHLLPDGAVEVPVPESYGGIGINHLVRQDWTRLTWLCWLAGLTEVALPDDFGPPVPSVPVYIAGHARYLLAHEVDPEEHLGQMLAAAEVASADRFAEIIAAATDVARDSTWFGVRIADIDEIPDADFLREDENAFLGALSFFTTPGYDLFGEQGDDDEDEDEDYGDEDDEYEDEDDDEDE